MNRRAKKANSKTRGRKSGPPAPTAKRKAKRSRAGQGNDPVAIVGIGASAGGLAALEELFTASPGESGMAFVVVMHLDAKQRSALAELLQRCTRMPVLSLAKKTPAKPNHVYVAPPGKLVSVERGSLRLTPLDESNAARLPIDAFFRSLAADQRSRAIGIVLSGTGSDGTLGVRAIKAEHGMIVVQDETAKYGGMPHSALETGLADFVLPPREMPPCLVRYRSCAPDLEGPPTTELGTEPLAKLQMVLAVLRARTGHDFSQYKSNTVVRRIQRRLALHQLDDLDAYLRFIKENHEESTALFRELLIGVTGFFRDAEAFDALQAVVQRRIDAGQHHRFPIRVWVPGCSTGEEAYSTTMLLQECIDAAAAHVPLQVFATDIDETAIEVARAGVYPAGVRSEVSTERIRRFFELRDDGRLRVKKRVREALVFATQNLISDPPFSRLDLICCRNLLIYFSSDLQRQILDLFHYSLNPDGLLFLGTSESVGTAEESFRAVDRKWKLFSRTPQLRPRSAAPRLARGGDRAPGAADSPHTVAFKPKEDANLVQLMQVILRETNTPPCALVDEALNVVYVHGRTGAYLEPAEGAVSLNILDMARPGLKEELGNCLRQATRDRVEVRRADVIVQSNGGTARVDLVTKPLSQPKALSDLTLVVFESPSVSRPSDPEWSGRKPPPPPAGTLDDLQLQLERTRESHQTTIEELETSNEELQSTNEELQSTNEELQSANEELGTSKEELQSLNEEAATVNAELQGRIDELSRANDDLKNLLDSTELATVFLDTDLNVRRFTPACSALIPLSAGDLGRSITHFATELIEVDLGELATAMLDDLVVRETEVATKDGRTYLLRVRPYRTFQNVIDGAVLTFEDRTLTVQARRIMEQEIEDNATELGRARRDLEASEARGKRRAPRRGKG